MDERHDIEKTATEVFKKLRLNWTVAAVQENRTSHTWDVEVQAENGSELILAIPHGSHRDIKKALMQQAEEEMDRLSLHHR